MAFSMLRGTVIHMFWIKMTAGRCGIGRTAITVFMNMKAVAAVCRQAFNMRMNNNMTHTLLELNVPLLTVIAGRRLQVGYKCLQAGIVLRLIFLLGITSRKARNYCEPYNHESNHGRSPLL